MVDSDTKLRRAVSRFLKTGKTGDYDPQKLSEDCNKVIRAQTQRSLPRAVEMATSFVKFSRAHPTMPLQLALRSLGWALHVSGQYRRAEKAYLEARALVRRDPLIRGRIDRILIDVYMYLGDINEAKRRSRLAINGFLRHGFEEDAAKTRVNLANLYHRQDRHREANKQYVIATEYFENHGGDLMLGLCYYNQANTLVQLFDFEKAEKLYGQAASKFTSLGLDLYTNECEYGLSWLHMLRGEYHSALQKLTACEETYKKVAQPKGEIACSLDRAEAFLGLNLFADARPAAQAAETAARRLGIKYEAAKGAFFGGLALIGEGKRSDALRALRRAESGFESEKNEAFLAATIMFREQVQAKGKLNSKRIREIRSRFARSQLPLWEAICDLHLLSQFPDEKQVVRRLRKNQAIASVPHLLSYWQTHLGDIEARKGRIEAAKTHWQNAAEALDAVRSKLPPVELRSSFMKDRSDPYCRLIDSEAGSDPKRASVWLERFSTAGVWSLPLKGFAGSKIRLQAEQNLARLASEVTVLASRIQKSKKRSEGGAQATNHVRLLQRQIQTNMYVPGQTAVDDSDRFRSVRNDIRAAAKSGPIVQFHFDKQDLLALVDDGYHTRAHRYYDGARKIREFLGWWNILLNRGLLANRKRSRSDLQEETRLLSRMGDFLWSPLEVPTNSGRVLVVPTGRLANLPWVALHSGGTPISDRYSLVLSPSVRHNRHADKSRVASKNIEIFVGQNRDLRFTSDEISTLLKESSSRAVVHEPCLRADWPDETSARIWHYTGHANFRSDNPFYSSLALDDGPLFAADFRMRRNKVALVTLAACRTGGQSVLPGDESTGLVRALIEMGARNVIASHWNVDDKSAALWMTTFYKALFQGNKLSEAAQYASASVKEKYSSAYHWAAFSIFGAG